MVKVRKKVNIFLESVVKTVFYVRCTPLNSDVGSLTLPLKGPRNQFWQLQMLNLDVIVEKGQKGKVINLERVWVFVIIILLGIK